MIFELIFETATPEPVRNIILTPFSPFSLGTADGCVAVRLTRSSPVVVIRPVGTRDAIQASRSPP